MSVSLYASIMNSYDSMVSLLELSLDLNLLFSHGDNLLGISTFLYLPEL